MSDLSLSFPATGVCYYPEHWPPENWVKDARRMRDAGLTRVRIAEFSWAKLEPEPGNFQWSWLDRAIAVLGHEGLEIVLGTPTATPPKWLVDQNPSMLAVDDQGRIRKFGSRRHYSFSSEDYRRECARIVLAMTKRYGENKSVVAWQTDNEYGCHDTTRSYCENAKMRFRVWLHERYGTIAALNAAWGTVFWSQTYGTFEQVDLPNLTVTEPNPSHMLDFYRFASDEVVSFNRLQTDLIRKHSPGRDIYHNFMGFYFGFDHFKVGADIDAATWDSYPLGFLDIAPYSDTDKQRYQNQGHPDFAAFHHDLYRRCGQGRWQVMEQQPGPVNWADHNPAPLAGMVRLWSHEAFAHGAEVVSYFRWRQAPFAQEQMHAGLYRADGHPAVGLTEALETSRELTKLPIAKTAKAPVALMFSYEAKWLFDIQPQGKSWNYPFLCMDWYTSLRRLGLDIDIVAPGDDLSGFDLVCIPSLPMIDAQTLSTFQNCDPHFIIGPRSGSKTQSLQIPDALAPGLLQSLIPLKITHSESFRPSTRLTGTYGDKPVGASRWLEHVETDLPPVAQTDQNVGLAYQHDRFTYLTTVPDTDFFTRLATTVLKKVGTAISPTGPDLRFRRHGPLTFCFNYGPDCIRLTPYIPANVTFLLGKEDLPPGAVACWKTLP